MHANDNQPAYFSRAVLDRSLVMRQRLRTIARQRAAATAGGQAPAAVHEVSDWHYNRRLFPWPRRWDEIGMFNQYGIAVVATLALSLGTLHVVGFVISG